jgi:hypothetical protein
MCHGFDGPRWTERRVDEEDVEEPDPGSPFADADAEVADDVELLTDGGDEGSDGA